VCLSFQTRNSISVEEVDFFSTGHLERDTLIALEYLPGFSPLGWALLKMTRVGALVYVLVMTIEYVHRIYNLGEVIDFHTLCVILNLLRNGCQNSGLEGKEKLKSGGESLGSVGSHYCF
jgi:hypothetical protein